MPRYKRTTAEFAVDFWSHIAQDNGPEDCWEWQGYRDRANYGKSYHLAHERQRGAHRVAWELTNGNIPPGLSVLHRCNNPPCVNPDHLYLGTGRDNTADMHRFRQAAGLPSPRAVLTVPQVREIRARAAAGVATRVLAKDFGVTTPTVARIVSRRNWAWLK